MLAGDLRGVGRSGCRGIQAGELIPGDLQGRAVDPQVRSCCRFPGGVVSGTQSPLASTGEIRVPGVVAGVDGVHLLASLEGRLDCH